MNSGGPMMQQSMFSWGLNALGIQYVAFLFVMGTLSFLIALLLTFRGRGSKSVVALILTVHLPFLAGIFLALIGSIQAFIVIASSAVSPKPSELAEGVSVALMAPLLGLLLMAPGYAVALIGSLMGSFSSDNRDAIRSA